MINNDLSFFFFNQSNIRFSLKGKAKEPKKNIKANSQIHTGRCTYSGSNVAIKCEGAVGDGEGETGEAIQTKFKSIEP